MPGLRYGPDITDDAEILRKNINRLKREKKLKGSLSRDKTRELNRYMRNVKAGFGNQKILNEFARYSRARQGYDPSGRTRTIAGVRFRGRPGLPKGLEARRQAATGISRRDIGGLTPRGVEKAAKKVQKARKAATKTAQRKKAAARKRVNKARRAKRAAKKAPARKRPAPRKAR